MTNQVIPQAAIEAAASRYWDHDYKLVNDPVWADAVAAGSRNDETGQVRGMMRAALEAAAPHMEEAAYGRGFDDGHRAGQESMEAASD